MPVADIHVGCCGFAGARERYYKVFPVVEIQQTFYEPPQMKTVEKWRAEAPREFEFTLKAWQLITHPATSPTYRRLRHPLPESERNLVGNFQVTAPVMRAWETTAEIARALRARIILFQCPSSFTPCKENLKNMEKFFRKIEKGDFVFAWEPRGKWDDATIRSICESHNLIHCVDPFVRSPVTGKINYFRLHGIGGYRYTYTNTDLERLNKLCSSDRRQYVLFNNHTMFEDAVRFKRLISTQ